MKKGFTIIAVIALTLYAKAQTITIFHEEFESGNLPVGWTTIDNDGDGYVWDFSTFFTYGVENSGCAASASYRNDVGVLFPDNWLVTPAIQITSNSDLTFRIAAQDANWAAENYAVYVATDNTVSAFTATTPVLSSTTTSTVFTLHTISLNDYVGQTVYIAFRHFNTSGQYWIKLDEVQVVAQPTTPTIAVSTHSVDFNHIALGNTSTSSVEVIACNLENGITATTSAPFSVSADGITFGSTATLPATGGSLYILYSSNAGGTDYGAVTLSSVGATDVTISLEGTSIDCTQAVSTFPWDEDFSGDVFPPLCWNIENTNTDTTWEAFEYYGVWASCLGTENYRTEKLITPTLDFSNYTHTILMTLDFMCNYYFISNRSVDFKIYASTDGGTTFSSTPLWKLSDFGEFEAWTTTTATIDLSTLAGQSNVKLAFVYEGSQCQVLFTNVSIRTYEADYNGIIYVTQTGSGTQTGESWENALSSISDALDIALDFGAVVWVAAGTYYGDTTMENAFTMVEGVNVYGGFAGNEAAGYDLSLRDFETNATILDGQDARRVLNQPNSFNAQTEWNGFTIQNGRTTGNGGGAYLQKNGKLSQCKVLNNTAYSGGGIYANYSTVTNCQVSNNTASSYGGGIYAYSYSTVTNCQVSNNTASSSGGIYARYSTVTNCQVSNNTASSNGGGIYAFSSTVTNCQVSNNTAYSGGGIYAFSSTIANSTIVRNYSRNETAGVYASSSSTLTNCIVWGNGEDALENISGSCTCSYSAIEGGYVGEGNIALGEYNPPRFVNPSLTAGASDSTLNVDWHLQQGSPCINRGSITAVADSLDLDGTARIKRDTVDMGCYESDYYSVPLTIYDSIIYVTQTGAGTHSGNSWSNATSSIADAQALARTHNAVVWVAAGTYHGDTTATNAFTMVDRVNVYGGFAGNEPAGYDLSLRDFETNATILDGQDARRVLNQPNSFNAQTEWNGFTIQNGRTTGDGGGACLRQNGKLSQCKVLNNTAYYGGGIYANYSTVTNCQVSNNTANYYGGIEAYSSTVTNCQVSNNTASSYGGGIYASSSTVTNCQVSNNTANYYGGIYASSSTIANSTIVRNYSRNGTAGVYASSSSTLTNCIVWGNGENALENISGSCTCSYSAIEGGYVGESNIALGEYNPPRFVNPSLTAGASDSTLNVDWHLQQGSPCINRGSIAAVADSLDLDGTARIKRDTVDMGCYESDYYSGSAANLPIVSTHPISDTTATSAVCGVTVTAVGGEILVCGVCWSTMPNPTIADQHTVDGASVGSFSSTLNGLMSNTTYYVRAYATNEAGTSYGEEVFFTTPSPYNGIIYVTQTGSGTQTGESWENALSSISDALDIALDFGAVVWVAAGTYYGDTTAENAFTMVQGINVYGGFAGNEPADYNLSLRDFETNATILDGQDARRVLNQPNRFNAQTEWNGFTIQNGRTTGNGGGAYLQKNGKLSQCKVLNNTAYYDSGGIYAYYSTVTNCQVSNNTANDYGGGIYARYSTVTNCQVSNNTASSNGGGIYAPYSTVTNCQVSNNTASSYGGIYASSSTVTNCLVSNNTASSYGGIYASSSTIANSTIVRNYSRNGTAGVYASSSSTLTNCIVWGNGENALENISGSCTCSYSAIEGGYVGEGNIALGEYNPPRFVNSSLTAGASDSTLNVDWHLQQGSPCINRGSIAAVADSLDLDGTARIKRDTVDMGCYESDYYSVPLTIYDSIIYVTQTGAGTHSGNSWSNATSSIADAQALARTHNAVVWVAAGTYHGDTTATNAFTMVDRVNVYGGFAGNEPAGYDLSLRDFETNATILDGQDARRVLNQPNNFNAQTEWNGFTIQNGRTTGNGGGAYLRQNGKLSQCKVLNNTASSYGGGIYAFSSIVTNCQVSNNTARYGGGIYASSSTVTNCQVSNNTASSYGGGINASSSTVTNCQVSNNTAYYYGGGIYASSSTIANSTIVRNYSRNGTAGVYASSSSTLTNCIVWGNGEDALENISGSCTCSYSAIEGGYVGESNIALGEYNPPRFVNPSLTAGASDSTLNVDWHLQQGSPCINRGSIAAVADSLDLDGTARIKRDTVDMGCYESDYYSGSAANLPIVSTHPISDTTATSAVCGVTVTAVGGEILVCGVCWSTMPNPTIADQHTVDGASVGSFSSTLNGLMSNTTYYVRAYATNEAGTSYGEEVFFTTPSPYNGIIYVTQTGSGTQTGESWENALSSISDALDIALDFGAVVWVAAGTYYGDTTAENAFTMVEGINVNGGFAGNEPAGYDLSQRDFEANTTILDGMNARRVLNQPSNFNAETKWDGFTIQKGQTSGNGAGVYMRNHGHLSHCKVQSNVSTNGNGGGVYCSNAVVEECDIVENTCRNSGGGIYIQSSSIVSDCRIVDNTTTSSQGGGVYSSSSTVTECLIKGNTSYSYGGGVHIVSSTIRDCNILENTSNNRGGGVNASSGNIISCQISHNQSSNAGGGLYISSSTQVRNCLVDNNSAGLSSSYGGGGIYGGGTVVNTTIVRNSSSGNGAGISGSASTNLKNCIVWGNKRNGEKNNISGNNIVCVNSAIEDGYSGTDLVLFDNSINNPLFVNPSLTAGASDSTVNVDWHLQNGSVCVNRGDNSAITDTIDLDGNVRIQRDTVDLGCYESDYYSVPMTMYDSIIYVTQAGAGNRSGNSWENAIPSIEEAQVLAQVYNAVVWVATGTYYGDTTAANAFTMIDGVNVYGGFAGNEPADYDLSQRDFEANTTILDGMNARRVLKQPSSFNTQTTWNGFALQNGQTSGNGGGAYLQNKGVLSQCEIMGCNANGGGGVYVSAGTISECLITDCTASNGGGVNCTNKAVISSCRIAGNNATGAGGGVYTYNSTIVDCDIIDNETSGSGGGVYCYYSTHVLNTQVSPSDILRCLISGNHSSNSGGGVCLGFANDKLNNCLVSNNSSNTTGGGVFGKGRINNTTVVRNYSTGEGGGLNAGSYNSYYSGNIMALNNCVVWGNVSNGGSNNIKGSSNTCTCSYSAIEEGYSGTGNILLDETNQPHFVNPAHTAGFDDSTDNVDWHLQQASVCINRGDNSAVTDTLDLDGNARIQRDTVDMGCYESDYYSVPMTEYDSIIYVTVTGAGTQLGDSWANATSSIEEAQTLAQTYGAVVWVAAGTYYGDTVSTSNNAFTMVDGVNVYGGFAGSEPADYDLSQRDFEANATILDGQNARRVLNQPSSFNAQTTWNGFVMQNGQTSGNGGGAYLQNNGVLSQCKIIACMAPNGGGVYNSRGTISECIISSCSANEGGGVNCTDNATISSCILSNNNATTGGGVFSYNSSIVDCDITMNAATGSGGGVYCYYRAGLYFYVDPTNVIRCRIVGNQASNGGGIWLGYGNDKVQNCLVSNNTANMAGGGIIGNGHVYNTTIVRNTSTDDGAGVNGSTSTTLTNCIVWGNERNGDVNNLNGSSIVCSYSAIEGGYTGDSIIVLNDINRPLFVNPSLTAGANDSSVDVDWHLQQGSVCVNRGNNSVVTDTLDLDGTARIRRDTVDMGCYESDYYSIPVTGYNSIIYVTVTGAGTQSGDSWANATSSIDEAQTLAQTYDAVVWVAAGTYYGDTTSNAFTMRDGVSVCGGFVGNEPANYDLSQRDFETNTTILDGQNARRVLYQPYEFNNRAEWNGFTIRNGQTSGSGAGAYLQRNAMLSQCRVEGNTSTNGSGGGVYCNNATVDHCEIVNNSCRNSGGGVYASSSVLSDCRIESNTATTSSGGGGGVYAISSTIANCYITDNQSVGNGGGAWSYNTQFTYCNIFGNNTTGSGGGVYSHYSTHIIYPQVDPTIISCCQIHGNQSGNSGGGIRMGYNNDKVLNSLVCNNTSGNAGGGINGNGKLVNTTVVCNLSNGNGGGLAGDIDLKNCIVWGNKRYGVIDNVSGNSVSCSYSAIEGGFIGEGNFILGEANSGAENSPCFANPTTGSGAVNDNGDWHLLPQSICINGGDPNTSILSEMDLDGLPRLQQSRVDMGCYEYQNVTMPIEDTVIITVVSDNIMRGVATGSGIYNAGDTVVLRAVPSQYARFLRWNDNDTNNPRMVIADTNTTFTATFDLDLPELHVTSITHSDMIGGESATVSWTVRNDGNVSTPDGVVWYDRVWLSLDPKVDVNIGSPILLGAFPNVSALAPDEYYTQTRTVDIPLQVSGDYYLFVIADCYDADQIFWENGVEEPYNPPTFYGALSHDCGGADCENIAGNKILEISEYDNYSRYPYYHDNFFYETVEVATPAYPDLVVTHVVPSSYPFLSISELTQYVLIHSQMTQITLNFYSGSEVTLSYRVLNDGNYDTRVSDWRDVIFISNHSEFDETAQALNVVSHSGLLLPDSAYLMSTTVRIPLEIYDTAYFYVYTDFYDQVYEHIGRYNNVTRSGAFNVILTPPADLVSRNITADQTVSTGATFNFSYEIHNRGAGEPNHSSWRDRCYLSTNPNSITNAVQIADDWHSGGIAVGGFYAVQHSISLPSNLSQGTYYLFVKADALDNVFEYTMEDNNLARFVQPISVLQPDLQIPILNVADTLHAGAEASVSYQLANTGDGAVVNRNVTDRFYLSQYSNGSNATQLPQFTSNLWLNAHDSTTKYQNVMLPSDLQDGIYYLFARTNVNNDVNEANTNNNQSPIKQVYINHQLLPDLVITSVTAPDTLTAGASATFTATIANHGERPTALGNLDFRLSAAATPNNILCTTENVSSESQSLAVGDSTTVTMTIRISPAVNNPASFSP